LRLATIDFYEFLSLVAFDACLFAHRRGKLFPCRKQASHDAGLAA